MATIYSDEERVQPVRLMTAAGAALPDVRAEHPHAVPADHFQFAGPVGGTVDAVDLVVAAARAAGIRNYLAGIQYLNTSAVASEIVVKDGSTVIWRGMAPASMTSLATVRFSVPLKGTAATAMNVAMVTTLTATRISAQGFTAA